MKWFRDYEELLLSRYERLYGTAESRRFIKQERRNIALIAAVLVLAVCLVIGKDISDHRAMYENVKVNNSGEILEITRPDSEDGTYSFNTKVCIVSDEGKTENEYYITIEPAGETTQEEEQLLEVKSGEQIAEAELKRLISGINQDTSEPVIVLPDCLENGEQLIWMTTEDKDPLIYMIIFIVMLWLLYRSRFSRVMHEEKKARESILRELPEFINKLVLLLSAGVVLNTAFLKIAEETSEEKIQKSYFYRRLSSIAQLVNETNAAFHQELYLFAKGSGVKELMRITNIIMDNISKGDDLADKLRRENQLLWFVRKQQAEEKGRLAETKMTMPLMIMLMVLIMVSISPALMEI